MVKRELCLYSFGLFGLHFKPRRIIINTVEHVVFLVCVYTLILSNAILLALYDPVIENSQFNEAINESSVYFIVFFLFEMILKLIAYGVYWEGRGTYFKDNWDTFDGLIVIVSLFEFFLSSQRAVSLVVRLIRIARPLRMLKLVPAMGWFLASVYHAGKDLLSALFLLSIVFLVYSFVGLVFFNGKFRQQCVDNITGLVVQQGVLCAKYRNGGFECDAGSTCVTTNSNPNYNVTSFDNIFSSMLIMFEVLTQEGWVTDMYFAMETAGTGSPLYFTSAVVVTSFIALNLFIAIIAVNVTVQRQLSDQESLRSKDRVEVQEEAKERGKRFEKESALLVKSQRKMEAFFRKNPSVHLIDCIEMRLMLSFERMNRVSGYDVVDRSTYLKYLEKHKGVYFKWKQVALPLIDREERKAARKRHEIFKKISKEQNIQMLYDHRFSIDQPEGEQPEIAYDTENPLFRIKSPSDRKIAPSPSSSNRMLASPPQPTQSMRLDTTQPSETAEISLQLVSPRKIEMEINQAMTNESRKDAVPFLARVDAWTSEKVQALVVGFTKWMDEHATDFGAIEEPSGAFQKARKYVHDKIVCARWFEPLMIFFIVLNICSLMSSEFNQLRERAEILEIIYISIWGIFVLEMLLKIFSFGLLHYLFDRWYFLEFVTVMFGIIEMALYQSELVNAFRAIRLLRVIRIFLFVKELKELMETLGVTIRVLFPFTLLLFAFLYLIALIGMGLFGNKLNMKGIPDCDASYRHYPFHCPPRYHWDYFVWAFVTSFAVLIGDEWNEINYAAIDATHPSVALFFIFVIMIGSSILLNLYLGVLIDAFIKLSDKRAEEEKLRKLKIKQEEHLNQARVEGVNF